MDIGSDKTPRKPVVIERSQNLPADIVHSREVKWLEELEQRLAAVRAWRGTHAVSRQSVQHIARPATASRVN